MIILGIDPGTATTGYGIIEKSKPLRCIDYGVIKTETSSTDAERLKKLNDELLKIIKKYKPSIMAVERLYFFKNLKTVMPVSQAKGVILLSAAQNNLPIREFTPPQVKMAVVGYGKAEKKQVQKMVKLILELEKEPKPDDAADALAVAICCSNFLEADERLLRS
jgi:crossover junction endodeoxyribonuclease RuvC